MYRSASGRVSFRVGIQEGWYPANIDVHLSWARAPGILGESGWAFGAAGASPIYANPLGRRFWHFRAVMETSRGRIATRGGTCHPGLHGQRCARLTSISGRSGAVEHVGEASHVSFRSAFRKGGIQPTPRYTHLPLVIIFRKIQRENSLRRKRGRRKERKIWRVGDSAEGAEWMASLGCRVGSRGWG